MGDRMRLGMRSLPAVAAVFLTLAVLAASVGAAAGVIDLSGDASGFSAVVGTWTVDGGTIRQTAPAASGWTTQAASYQTRTFGDFVLEYKVKVGDAAWAGAAFRVSSPTGFGVEGGYTLIHGLVGTQLFDMKNQGLQSLANMQGFIEGDFNTVRLVVSGTLFKVYVNDTEQVPLEFDGLDAYREGYIALLSGNGSAEFKDIRITDGVPVEPTVHPTKAAPTRDPDAPTPTAEALFVGYAGEGIRLSPEDGRPTAAVAATPTPGPSPAAAAGFPAGIVAGGVAALAWVAAVAALLIRRRTSRKRSGGVGRS